MCTLFAQLFSVLISCLLNSNCRCDSGSDFIINSDVNPLFYLKRYYQSIGYGFQYSTGISTAIYFDFEFFSISERGRFLAFENFMLDSSTSY